LDPPGWLDLARTDQRWLPADSSGCGWPVSVWGVISTMGAVGGWPDLHSLGPHHRGVRVCVEAASLARVATSIKDSIGGSVGQGGGWCSG